MISSVRIQALRGISEGLVEGLSPLSILLEEPESYQHPRYLRELASLLLQSAAESTQVILSTHSIELVDLLLHAPEAQELPYPTVHRLRLNDGRLTAVALRRDQAITLRDQLLEDLRS